MADDDTHNLLNHGSRLVAGRQRCEASRELVRRFLGQRAILTVVELFLLAALGTASEIVAAEAPDGPAPRDYLHDYRPSFKVGVAATGLSLFGPDAKECVKFEPDGLRIT